MNIVYLSPHFPPNYHKFCESLQNTGANVLGIADEAYDNLPPVLRLSITEYYRVEDMHNYDQLLRACGFFTHRYGKINRLDSLNEYWIETEAKIRDDFNIFGIRTRQLDGIKKKSQMKELFRGANVKVARGKVVKSIEEAKALIKDTGYPVVAKPDIGVGALNTYKIHNDKELKKFFDEKPPVDYIMEEFIKGTIYSYDGLTDSEGNIVFETSHVFSQGIMETVNENRNMTYYSLTDIPKELLEEGRRTVKAFDIRERFYHIEFFNVGKNGKDDFVALEVNMRPPGGYTTDMFNFACDFDIYKIWADLVTHNKNDVDYERKYHCSYHSRKHDRQYKHHHDDIINKFGDIVIGSFPVAGVFRSALGDEGYIARTNDLDKIKALDNYLQEIN